jgi:hypothetical protein
LMFSIYSLLLSLLFSCAMLLFLSLFYRLRLIVNMCWLPITFSLETFLEEYMALNCTWCSLKCDKAIDLKILRKYMVVVWRKWSVLDAWRSSWWDMGEEIERGSR